MKQIALFAVDIETSGSSLTTNGIVAIGYCLGLMDGTVIAKKRICMQLPEGACFEDQCWKRFWAYKQDLLKELQENALTPEHGIKDFANDLTVFESLYDLRILSDHPSFDVGFINYYLNKYLAQPSLSYSRDGLTYRSIYDTDSFTRGVLGLGYDQPWTSDSKIIEKYGFDLGNVINDHKPENDAHYIYELHRQIVNRVS